MSDPVSAPEWRVRVSRPQDESLLASFRCADPATAHQVAVENVVRSSVLKWALDPGAADDDPRLLLTVLDTSGELVGIAAHERTTFESAGQQRTDATKLEVVALPAAWQGRRFESGVRASDVVMFTALTDILSREPTRNLHVVAYVHEENQRSPGLLQRHGFTQEIPCRKPGFRLLSTP